MAAAAAAPSTVAAAVLGARKTLCLFGYSFLSAYICFALQKAAAVVCFALFFGVFLLITKIVNFLFNPKMRQQ